MGYTLPRLVRIGFSIVLFAALSSAACAQNNTSIFIEQVQAITPDNLCVATPDPSAVFWSSGLMDVAYASEYDGELLVGNQLVSRGDQATMRPESARVQLYSADLTVFDASGATLSSFSVPISGFVDVGSGNTPGYGVVHVPLIDAATAAAIPPGQTVVSRVKIYGVTLGDIQVETGNWDYPIYVCAGCIKCVCPATADADYAKSCNPGQNEAVDCRLATCWNAATGTGCGCKPAA